CPAVTNVLVQLERSSSWVRNGLDGETVLDIAQDVTKEVIAANRGLRFGLFTFRQGSGNDLGPGGLLRVEAGSIAPGTAAGEARFTSINQTLGALDPGRSGRLSGAPPGEGRDETGRQRRGARGVRA